MTVKLTVTFDSEPASDIDRKIAVIRKQFGSTKILGQEVVWSYDSLLLKHPDMTEVTVHFESQ